MSVLSLLLAVATLSLNGIWDFKFLPSETNDASRVAWSKIEVPSNWEMQGFGTPRYGTDIEGKCISGEVGVYRRTFDVPQDWGDRLFLRFDGVMFGASVTINGRKAADFITSYNRREFDVTEFLRRDAPNEIVVRTHGYPKGAEFDTHDDWILHGIFRDVTLVSRPEVHLRDWILTTRLDGVDAEVNVSGTLTGAGTVEWSLVAPDGRKLAVGEGLAAHLRVERPPLWTAETPHLCRLEMTVKDAADVVTECLTERVGLREISWDGRIFRVNGNPVKLRGVDHHDLSPVNGRAITAEEQFRDVQLIRAANCNFIRTSHYPPSVALMDACDELGVYLMDEIPFGYGDRHLTDSSYGPLLIERAELTLERDKNRPSVVIWSVGNENPITDIMRAVARRVRELDPSRPWCFPMQPNEFKRSIAKMPPSDFGDLVNWHYPLICGSFDKIQADLDSFDRPYLFGEYAHAYGTDFGYFEDYWTRLWDDPAFAGGGVWMFQDQGILRKASDLTENALMNQAWPDAEHIYDTFGSYGTDGIVYSDRTPLTSYYEVRKVYTPVVCGRAYLPFPSGIGTNWWISVENRYDHLRLDQAVEGEWRLRFDRSIVACGRLPVPPLAPHAKGFLCLDGARQELGDASVIWLEVLFRSRVEGMRVYEKSYVLTEAYDNVRNAARTTFAFDLATGLVRIGDADGRTVLESPILARVDRRSMIGKDSHVGHVPPLVPTTTRIVHESEGQLELAISWSNLSGRVTFASSGKSVRIAYEFQPMREMEFVEAGLAFRLPREMRRFDWVGDGPYESYPHCSKLSDFGIWSLDRDDLYFPGNRANVRVAAASFRQGPGLLLLPMVPANVVFERDEYSAIIGHNAHVGGKGAKFRPPVGLRTLKKGERLSGSFDLLAVPSERPHAVKSLLGEPTYLSPFRPFHAVYDQQ